MSRGLGRVQRFVLAELAKDSPGWPPWITVEVMAARYAGVADGEIVAARCADDVWRGHLGIQYYEKHTGVAVEPTVGEHLIGLSVENGSNGTCSQHLGRSVVESTRRAVKALAIQGRLATTWVTVPDRGGCQMSYYGPTRSSAMMLACRRLLTEAEAEVDTAMHAQRLERLRVAMAMIRGGR